MELSTSAREIITQAQMFKMENNADELCAEHLLYGLLVLAKENSSDGRKVKEYVSRQMMNPEAAMKQLKIDAKEDSGYFNAAAPVLGRATELADGGEIGCMELARAVFESNTPTILALKGLVAFHEPPEHKPTPTPARVEPSPNPTPSPSPVKVEPASKPDGSRKLNTGERALLLALLAAAVESQKDDLTGNSGKRANKGRPNVRRRTKMGPFTYRGGTVAAVFQYFLFGILVPLAVAFAVQRFTGFFSKPHAPFVTFIVGTLGALWLFYLARGVALVLGIASSALGNFLNIVFDVGLIYALVKIIQNAWGMPEVPTWLRLISCIAVLLVSLVGGGLFEYLKYDGDVYNARVYFMNLEGSPGKIFFQYAVRLVRVPFVIFAVIWIFRLTPPDWLMKVFWIGGFGYAWTLLNVAFTSISMCFDRTGGAVRKFFWFLKEIVSYLAVPATVVFLHWLFRWGSLKIWVIVILAAYTVLALLLSIASTSQH